MLQAGKLRHRVTLKSLTQAADEYGDQTDTWTTYAIVWASIEPLQGLEFIHAQQVEGVLTHRVTMRYDSDNVVDETHRVIYGSRTLEVVNVINPDERNEYVVCMCKEVV